MLGDEKPLTERPGAVLPPTDLDAERKKLAEQLEQEEVDETDLASHLMYPKVFADYAAQRKAYGDVSVLPTTVFFEGMQENEETAVDLEPGKTLVIRLLGRAEAAEQGVVKLFFELNGRRRDVVVPDRNSGIEQAVQERADPANADHVGAPMSGQVAEIYVSEGDTVEEGQRLLATEAMKMLNVVPAPHAGTVKRLLARPGATVLAGDLLCEIG